MTGSALMHRGKVRRRSTRRRALIAGLGVAGATLDDVFRAYTGDDWQADGTDQQEGLRNVRGTRRTARRARLTRPPGRARRRAYAVARSCALCLVELQKLRRDKTELVTRAVQPALWLIVFGTTFTRLRAIPTGDVPYLDFLAPGVIAQSALFISIFYGIQIIWERDAGVLAKLMVTPDPAGRAGHRQGLRGRRTRAWPQAGGRACSPPCSGSA